MESDVILLQDIFTLRLPNGPRRRWPLARLLKTTGLRPHITQRLADRGIQARPEHFRADVWPQLRPAVAQLGTTPPVPSGASVMRR